MAKPFKGWVVRVGTSRISEYVLCRRKPEVHVTHVRGRDLYTTGSPWFYKFCQDGFEQLMRAQFPLGHAAPITITVHLDRLEELEPKASPWLQDAI